MPSPILLLLLALAILHTSMAIKCFSQPDKDEAEKEFYQARKIPGNQIRWEEAVLKVMNRSVEVDCAEKAREHNFTDSDHCFSVNFSSCSAGRVEYFDSTFGGHPEFGKNCLFADPEVGPNYIITFGFGWVNATHENFCDVIKKERGCTSCYTCNETDFCNAGPEKKGTGKTAEKIRHLP